MTAADLTPAEAEAVATALARDAAHRRQTEAVVLRLLGGAEAVARGRALKDPRARLSWYAGRIFDLGHAAGAARQRCRRCRRTDGAAWRRNEALELDCYRAADALTGELLLVDPG